MTWGWSPDAHLVQPLTFWEDTRAKEHVDANSAAGRSTCSGLSRSLPGRAWRLFLLQVACLCFWGCNRLSVYCVKNGAPVCKAHTCENIFIFLFWGFFCFGLWYIHSWEFLTAYIWFMAFVFVHGLCLFHGTHEKMVCDFVMKPNETPQLKFWTLNIKFTE